MLIAQISDTHIVERGRKTANVAPMAENLARCVEHINQLTLQPDLVLITGDLTNNGLEAETAHAAEILRALRPPYYVVPGNHDDRVLLARIFGREACPTESDAFIGYVIESETVRLVAVDSTKPGAPGGEIDAERAAWLDRRLSEARTQPTLLFMHHPPVRFGVPETDVDGFEGRERLAEVLDRHPQVERILAGHIHLAALTRWRGIVVSTAPSTGMRLTLELGSLRPSEFILDDPAYQLHYRTSEGNLVTYTIRIHGEERSYPFAP